MKRTLNLLQNSPVVKDFQVLDYRAGRDFQYFKIVASIKDDSKLYIREYQSMSEFHYSYHWQEADGKLISRWDNAPHHSEISTYPHHRHTRDHNVEPFEDPSLETVLKWIEENI